MNISLWVLVDSSGRIWYTGTSKYIVDNAPVDAKDIKLYSVELKGKANV